MQQTDSYEAETNSITSQINKQVNMYDNNEIKEYLFVKL